MLGRGIAILAGMITADQQPTASHSAWQRWLPYWNLAFVALLIVALALTFSQPPTNAAHDPLVIVLTLALLAWYFLHDQHPLKRSSWVYFTLGWGVWFALTGLSSAYFVLLFILFPHVFMQMEVPYSIGAAGLLNTLVLIHLSRISPELVPTWMMIVLFTFIGGSLLAYFITDIIRQSEQRQQLIATLEATRDDLAKAQHAAGVLAERGRVAGELHDTIAQGLIALILQLENAENAVSETARLTHIQRAKTLARDNLNEARRFIWEMRPAVLEQHSFDDGLKHVVEAWSKSTPNQVNAALTITGSPQPLPAPIELAILRVLQEALANVTKHAHATHVTVTLSYMLNEVLLDVCDDGIGLEDRQTLSASGRFGLVNMRRRVEKLGGQLTLESATGEGTTLTAAFPLGIVEISV